MPNRIDGLNFMNCWVKSFRWRLIYTDLVNSNAAANVDYSLQMNAVLGIRKEQKPGISPILISGFSFLAYVFSILYSLIPASTM